MHALNVPIRKKDVNGYENGQDNGSAHQLY